MDIDDDDLTRILLKEYRDELRMYQLEILKELIMENVVVVVQNSVGEWELEIVSA
jgi:ERCC4-related helicase